MLYPILTVLTKNVLRAAKKQSQSVNCFIGAHWTKPDSFEGYTDDEGAKGVTISFKMGKNPPGCPKDSLVIQIRNVVYGNNCDDIELIITSKTLGSTSTGHDHVNEVTTRRILYNVSSLTTDVIAMNFKATENIHRSKVGDVCEPIETLLNDMFDEFSVVL